MKEFNRRDFFKYVGIGSAGFFVRIQTPLAAKKMYNAADKFENHYFVMGPNEGDFVFVMDKAEMGQGVITGQITLFCEELDLDPGKLTIIPAPVDPFYGTLGGLQITGGSTSTPDRWEVLRQAGANIRGALLKAAAKKLGVSPNGLLTYDGFVATKGGNQKLSYNDLATVLTLDGNEKQKLKEKEDYKFIGKYRKRPDASDKSLGMAKYGIDFNIEGMLTAVILRCPTFGGKVKAFDKSQAIKLPGIKNVLEVSSGVAIVGKRYWQLLKARELVKVDWDKGENVSVSSEMIQKKYKELLDRNQGKKSHSVGDVDEVFDEHKDGQIITAEYELPYLAHATMEPMNATASVEEDKVDIWCGTQAPTSIQNKVANYLGLSRDQVNVHNMKYLGGGFGRRSTTDYPLEAVELSKILKKPVKVIWSREDDMQFGPMRPINRHHIKGLVKDGKILAWEHRIGCESLMQSFMPSAIPHLMPGWLPAFLTEGLAGIAGGVMSMVNFHKVTGEGANHDYDIPNQYVGIQSLDLSIPIHFWRSVGNSYNGFVKESFLDELAYTMKRDPLELRRELLKKNPRALGVVNRVAKMSNWETVPSSGVHRGIAYHFSFGTFVAEVAEVRIKDGDIKVEKVYCAVDCGVAINPEIIADQMKSGILYGLSAVLGGKIDVKDGGVVETNFHEYKVVTMPEAPDIEVSIIDSDISPKGVGEPGLPPIAAAVSNAVFAATGKRLRKMPLSLS